MTDPTTHTIAVIRKELGEIHMARVKGEITADSDLMADLDVNSFDRVCITVAIEEAFDIELPDSAVEGWERIADVAASVAALVGESA